MAEALLLQPLIDLVLIFNVDIDSKSGNVNLRLPQNSAFYLRASALSGEIKNEFPITATRNSGHNSLEVQ